MTAKQDREITSLPLDRPKAGLVETMHYQQSSQKGAEH